MAQGELKKATKAKSKAPAQLTRRGSRIIKPKKPFLISQQKVKKAHTSGLTGQTEKLLGERAGHLELLKGGKRDKKNAVAAAKAAAEKAKGT